LSFTLSEIAAALGAECLGAGDLVIQRVCEPADAGPDDLALAMDEKYTDDLQAGQARAALLWAGADWRALGLSGAILMARGSAAMPALTRMMDNGPEIASGIHPTAVIDPTATLGAGACVGPFVVIGQNAKIGANARIASHVSIAENARLGADALIHSGVRIGAQVVIGDRFIAQPNAVIGGDGFSFKTPEKSAVETLRDGIKETAGKSVEGSAQWARVHSLGTVIIGDDVEVGAGTTIDRGTIRATEIRRGTKLDNLVQIGHNCIVGEDCLLCGHVGIAGSVQVGDRVVLAGKVGVSDNIFIGDDVIAGGGTNIYTNVPAGRAILGSPAVKIETQMAIQREMRRLPRLAQQLRKLQESVSKMVEKD